MDEVHELPQETGSTRHLKKWLILLLVAAIAGALTGFILLRHHRPAPISAAIRGQVSFPVYYPKSLPQGYSLDVSSVTVAQGLLFYVLANGDKTVAISEQAAPANPPSIKNIAGNSNVKTITTPDGTATLGPYKGAPTGIMLTKTTLINISASKETPTDQVSDIIQTMRAL